MQFGLTQYAESPTQQAMTLAEAKAHLRIDFDDSDTLISGLIDAATLAAEAYTSAAFIERSYLMTLGAFPRIGAGQFGPDTDYAEFPSRWGTSGRPTRYPTAIRLPFHPVLSVSSITYLDPDLATQTVAASDYVVVVSRHPPFIAPATGTNWPNIGDHPEAVSVAFRAGYGTCPANALAAIKLILGHLYEHREDVTPGVGAPNPAELPMGSKWLLTPYRLWAT